MKRGRFSEEQIVGILKEHEAGRKIAELAREHGVSEATLYGWKSKYGGMEVGEAQRLKGSGRREPPSEAVGGRPQPGQRSAEGNRTKKRLELAGLRADAAFAMKEFAMSERRACRLVQLDRSSYRYEPRADHNAELREELVKLGRQKPRYGYRRLHVLLNRRGHPASAQRIYRLYREERLMVRRPRRKRLVRPANEGRLLLRTKLMPRSFLSQKLAKHSERAALPIRQHLWLMIKRTADGSLIGLLGPAALGEERLDRL